MQWLFAGWTTVVWMMVKRIDGNSVGKLYVGRWPWLMEWLLASYTLDDDDDWCNNWLSTSCALRYRWLLAMIICNDCLQWLLAMRAGCMSDESDDDCRKQILLLEAVSGGDVDWINNCYRPDCMADDNDGWCNVWSWLMPCLMVIDAMPVCRLHAWSR